MNRLTLNYGARWEYFAHGIPVETSPAGRFTAARTFGPIEMPTWKSIAPRFGAVYDLFGNQKTALKFSLGKYMQAGSTGFAETYNPLALTTGERDLDRPERRQGAARRAGLHLPERRLRDQPRAAAERLRRRQHRELRSGHQADVQHRNERERPARAAAARLGVRRLVPSRLQEPAPARQRAAVVRRLHAVHAVQPDRRHARSPTTT